MDPNYTSGMEAMGAGFFTVYYLISFLVSILFLVAFWKIFTKADKPGWASLIPFYNTYLFYEITWGKGVYMFLMFIPLVNAVVGIMTLVKLAKAFNKGTGFALGLIFLSFIFVPILAFGDSEYAGVPN